MSSAEAKRASFARRAESLVERVRIMKTIYEVSNDQVFLTILYKRMLLILVRLPQPQNVLATIAASIFYSFKISKPENSSSDPLAVLLFKI